MSFGIGIGAFADGFMRGVNMGKTLKGVKKENEADALRKKLMEEATESRNAQIEAETARLSRAGIGEPPGQTRAAEQLPVEGQAQTFPVDMSGNTPPSQQVAPTQAIPQQPTQTPAPSEEMAPAPAQPAPGGTPAQPSPQQPVPAHPAAGGIEVPPNMGMTPEQARKVAEQSAPTVIDLFRKEGVPKIAEFYLANGDPEKAEAWLSYAETADSKKNMELWSRAWRATQLGNIEGAADHFFDLYKRMDDSVELSGKEVVKDKEGNITGFNVKMRDKASGENRAVFVDREQLLNMGLSAMSPPKMFEAVWQRQAAAEKARTDAAAEAGKINMQAAKELAVEDVRQRGRLELEDYKASRPGPLGQKIEDMRRAGATQEQIQGVLNAAAMADDAFKKGASPQETKRQLITNLSKQYVDYAGQPTKTPQEIAAEADEYVAAIFSGNASGTTPAAPIQGGATNPAARGLPVLDTKTGKVIYR